MLEAGQSISRSGEFSGTGKQGENAESAQKAAQLMHVSDFSVKAADKVKKQGVRH